MAEFWTQFFVNTHPLLFNVEHYQWRPSKKDPNLWYRHTLAAENGWIQKPRDTRQMRLGLSISLQKPIHASLLEAACRVAWRWLRYQHPEIALIPFYSGTKGLLTYRSLLHETEIEEWVSRTVKAQVLEGSFSFADLRALLGEQEGVITYPALLYLYPWPAKSNSAIQNVEIILEVDHLCTDGIGIRTLGHCLLSLLSKELSSTGEKVSKHMDWEKSAKNLQRPWISLVDHTHSLKGANLEKCIRDAYDRLHTHELNTFRLRTGLKQQEHFHMSVFKDFSLSDSAAIVKGVKEQRRYSCTVTHLCHAAMILATLRSSLLYKVQSKGEPFASACFVNGRRHLRLEERRLTEYIPVCLAAHYVLFDCARDYPASDNRTFDETDQLLVQLCSEAKTAYRNIQGRESVFSEHLVESEFHAQQMRIMRILKNEERRGHAQPYLLSDGVIENYIDHAYYNKSKSEKSFDVDDVRFAANADGQSLIVRLCSWKGRISISGEWNQADYELDEVRKFLDDVAALMLLVTEMRDEAPLGVV